MPRENLVLVPSIASDVRESLRTANAFDQKVVSRSWLHTQLDFDPAHIDQALESLASGNSCLRWGEYYSLPRDIRATEGGAASVTVSLYVHDVVENKHLGRWCKQGGSMVEVEREAPPKEQVQALERLTGALLRDAPSAPPPKHPIALVELEMNSSLADAKPGRELVRFLVHPSQEDIVLSVLRRGLGPRQGITSDGRLVAKSVWTPRNQLAKLAKSTDQLNALLEESVRLLCERKRLENTPNPPGSYDDLETLVGDSVGIFDVMFGPRNSGYTWGKMHHKGVRCEVWEATVPRLHPGEAAVWNDAGELLCVIKGPPGTLECFLPTRGRGAKTARSLVRLFRQLADDDSICSPVEHAVTCIREVAAEFDQTLPDDDTVAAALEHLKALCWGVFTRDGELHVEPLALDFVLQTLSNPHDGEDTLPCAEQRVSRAQVLSLVRLRGPATLKRLAECVGLDRDLLRPLLDRLVRSGEVTSERVGPWTRFFVEDGPDTEELLEADILAAFKAREEPTRTIKIAREIRWDATRVDQAIMKLWRAKILKRGDAVENGRTYIGYVRCPPSESLAV